MKGKSLSLFFGIKVLVSALIMVPFMGAPVQSAEKVWEINLAHHIATTHALHTKAFVLLKDDIEKESNGRIKVTIYPSAALGKAEAVYDLTVRGVMDIALFLPIYFPGTFPLSDVVSLPLVIPDADVGRKVTTELLDRRLFDEKLYDKIKVWLGTTSGYQFFLAKKKVTKLEDLKGLRLRTPGGLMTKALQNLGATPVTVPGAEFQTAMERGIVDGGVVAAISGAGYNLQEFTKYVFKADLGVSVIGVSINKKLYDSLPEDLKKVVDKGCKNYLVNQTKVYDSYDEEAYESFKKTGAEISTLEPAEKKRWLKVCTPIYSEWITDMEKKGLPGKKLYEEFKKILAGYGVELPI